MRTFCSCRPLAVISFVPLNSFRSNQHKYFRASIVARSRLSMKIHEYQGKELLKRFGVPVPRGIVARSVEEAFHAAEELACYPVVVKAQIHAGGRGKGGGVK